MGKSAIEGLGLLMSPKATLLILEAARERAGEGGEREQECVSGAQCF